MVEFLFVVTLGSLGALFLLWMLAAWYCSDQIEQRKEAIAAFLVDCDFGLYPRNNEFATRYSLVPGEDDGISPVIFWIMLKRSKRSDRALRSLYKMSMRSLKRHAEAKRRNAEF